MSFCSDDILLLAGTIYSGVGAPPAQSVTFVSGWLTAPNTLGDLNNRLSTAFAYTGGCIAGGFTATEGALLNLIYNYTYYEQQSRAVLTAGGIMWTSMGEGDSRVTRASPVEMSRAFLALSKDAKEDLYVGIANWTTNHSAPCSVDTQPPAAWPSP